MQMYMDSKHQQQPSCR